MLWAPMSAKDPQVRTNVFGFKLGHDCSKEKKPKKALVSYVEEVMLLLTLGS